MLLLHYDDLQIVEPLYADCFDRFEISSVFSKILQYQAQMSQNT